MDRVEAVEVAEEISRATRRKILRSLSTAASIEARVVELSSANAECPRSREANRSQASRSPRLEKGKVSRMSVNAAAWKSRPSGAKGGMRSLARWRMGISWCRSNWRDASR